MFLTTINNEWLTEKESDFLRDLIIAFHFMLCQTPCVVSNKSWRRFDVVSYITCKFVVNESLTDGPKKKVIIAKKHEYLNTKSLIIFQPAKVPVIYAFGLQYSRDTK